MLCFGLWTGAAFVVSPRAAQVDNKEECVAPKPVCDVNVTETKTGDCHSEFSFRISRMCKGKGNGRQSEKFVCGVMCPD